jgi:hypothetical protein
MMMSDVGCVSKMILLLVLLAARQQILLCARSGASFTIEVCQLDSGQMHEGMQ